MIKQRQEGLATLHSTVLAVTIVAAYGLLYVIVQTLGWIRFNDNVHWGLYLAGVIVAMFWIRRSLRAAVDGFSGLTWKEAIRLTGQQLMRLMVVLFALAFTTKDVAVSRAFLEGFLVISGLLLLLANRYLPGWLARIFFDQRGLRTIIMANAAEAQMLQGWLDARRHLGMRTLGYVSDEAHGPGRLGSPADLRQLLSDHGVDQVVMAQSMREKYGADVAQIVEDTGCRLRCFVNMDEVFGGRPALMEHDEHYTFSAEIGEPLDNPCNRMLKRALDMVVAVPVVLFVLPPLTLAVWVMQTLQSPGPIFYTQQRSGLNRRRFLIRKFRTMNTGGEALRGKQATQNDSRVFAFGRFLRRTSLDEMPQFINVILGDMSVSGPRPHLLEHDERFAKIDHSYYKRHYVKPGITGLAQTMGFRGEVLVSNDLINRVHYDEVYVANWSLGLDLRILLQTVGQILHPPRKAY